MTTNQSWPTTKFAGTVDRSPETLRHLKQIDAQIKRMAWLAFILSLGGIAAAVWSFNAVGSDTKTLGTLGTLLAGTVAPIWSLSGLVLIYIAFLGQRRQIVLQEEGIELSRQELRDTREELRGQKEQLDLQRVEMVTQNKTIQKQAFEQSFFELLQFHRQLATQIVASPGGSAAYSGQPAFALAATELTARLGIRIDPEPTRTQWMAVISDAFHSVCLAANSDFSSYFRTMYHLLRQIDDSGLPGHARYASLMRAQLSNAELILLFVDGLSDVGREKFKPLIERYGMLKPIRLPPQLDWMRSFYSPPAFSSSPAATA